MRWALLALAVLLYGLHFLHLGADFPAGTGWNDWSRFTDEGWYSDAATRHFVLGHWYLPGEFNPAVAMPVWPLLLGPAFALFGLSIAVARGLMVGLWGLGLLGVWLLLEPREHAPEEQGFAGPLAVFLLAANPFVYAFTREAVLEPLLVTAAVWVLAAAGRLRPARRWPAVALGLLLPTMILVKPTGVALLPAVGWMVWAQAEYRWREALRRGWLPAVLAAAVWAVYFLLWVRPRYLLDYQYLFTANEYTSFQADPLWQVLYGTLSDALWMGTALCAVFVVVLVWVAGVRPALLRRPLLPVLLVWIVGYVAFLAYHNNLQSRYYLPLAVPVTMLAAVGLEAFALGRTGATSRTAEPRLLGGLTSRVGGAGVVARWVAAAACVLAIAVPDLLRELQFVCHPAYTFLDAARRIAATVRADRGHAPTVLSVSGSDLSLMTGLPSLTTEFGVMDLHELVARYRPGWYVTWNEVDDEDLQGIAPLYRLEPVASFPAMDDPDRNVLLLYRLEPKR